MGWHRSHSYRLPCTLNNSSTYFFKFSQNLFNLFSFRVTFQSSSFASEFYPTEFFSELYLSFILFFRVRWAAHRLTHTFSFNFTPPPSSVQTVTWQPCPSALLQLTTPPPEKLYYKKKIYANPHTPDQLHLTMPKNKSCLQKHHKLAPATFTTELIQQTKCKMLLLYESIINLRVLSSIFV